MGNAFDYVNKDFCKALPNFLDQSTKLEELYMPNLVETLQVYATLDQLCKETKLCPSAVMMVVSVQSLGLLALGMTS